MAGTAADGVFDSIANGVATGSVRPSSVGALRAVISSHANHNKTNGSGQASHCRDRLRHVALMVLGIWMALCGGTLYAFSAWEVELMSRCQLSARRLDIMYALGQLGVGAGLVPGAIYDNLGPRTTAFYALLLMSIGNLGLVLALQADNCMGLFTLGSLHFVLQNGCTGLYQAGLFSNIRSSPASSQGTVAGIVAAGYGLSAAFWSYCYEHVLGKSLVAYFYSTAIVFAATALLAAASLRCLMVPCDQGTRAYGQLHNDMSTAVGRSQVEPSDEMDGFVIETETLGKPHEGSKCAMAEILRTCDFWLFLVTFASVQAVGSGIFIANLALMGGSLEIPAETRNTFVQLVSYCNCAGRFLSGLLMDFGEPRGIPRAAHMVLTSGTIFLVCGVLMVAPGQALLRLFPPALVLIGLAYGANWAIMPSFLAARFGSENVGCCFNITGSLMSLSVLLASTAVGGLYDSAAASQALTEGGMSIRNATSESNQTPDHEAELCRGASCWRSAYLLAFCLSGIGFVTAVLGARFALARLRDKHSMDEPCA